MSASTTSPATAAATPAPPALVLVAAVVFSGSIQALIAPPASWIWIHPVSWIPALWAFSQLSGRKALLYGWLCGIAAQGAIFSWLVDTITIFSNIPLVGALIILLAFAALFGFYTAVFAWGVGRIRARSGRWWPAAVAAWFCAAEFLNPQLFPYFQGVAWYQQPGIFLLTAVTGVAGMSFLVMLANSLGLAALEGWLARRRGDAPDWSALKPSGVLLAGALVLALGYCQVRLGAIEAAEAASEPVKLAMIQTNRDVFERRAQMRRSKGAIARDHEEVMSEALREHPDIDAFVLPEGALRGRPDWPANYPIREFVAATGKEVWTGGSSFEDDGGERLWFNSAFHLRGDGSMGDRYDKNVLLPFGEYMPFEDVLPILEKIQGVGNYHPGADVIVYDALADRVRFAFLICYEAILSRYVRKAVNAGTDLLVNISYDAWYGDTACPHQFFMLVALQSAQNGVPTVRAATTGISAFVDARGRIVQSGPLFERLSLVGEARPLRLPGLYTKLGDWFAWLCVLGALGLLLRREDSSLRSRWPLGLVLLSAGVHGVVLVFGLGPMG